MIGFALLICFAGSFLIARPDVWWAVNESAEARDGHEPSGAYLRRIRRQGWSLLIGGSALFIVQLLK